MAGKQRFQKAFLDFVTVISKPYLCDQYEQEKTIICYIDLQVALAILLGCNSLFAGSEPHNTGINQYIRSLAFTHILIYSWWRAIW